MGGSILIICVRVPREQVHETHGMVAKQQNNETLKLVHRFIPSDAKPYASLQTILSLAQRIAVDQCSGRTGARVPASDRLGGHDCPMMVRGILMSVTPPP